MAKKYLLIIINILIVCGLSMAQDTDKLKQINVSASSGSSIILESGEFEIIASSSLAFYNSRISYSSGNVGGIEAVRNSFSSTSLFANIGLTQSKIFDLGVGVDYLRSRFDFDALSSPFKVYGSDSNVFSGISNLRLRLRTAPFASLNTLVFSVNGRYPIGKNNNGQYLGAEKIVLGIGAAYFGNLGANDNFYLQAGLDYGLEHDRMYDNFEVVSRLPSNQNVTASGYVIFNLFARKLYILPGLSYNGSFQTSVKSNDWLQRTHNIFGNLVIQIQPLPGFALTLQQGLPIYSKSHIPSFDFEKFSFYTSAISLRFLLQGSSEESGLLIDKYLK